MLNLVGYVLAATIVTIPRCDTAPVVDGRLGEACWSSAATLKGFVQTKPGDNTAPSRDTTVLLAYGPRALYIGIRAADDPARVRATVARRDDVLGDDHVALYLDTFDDRRRAYVLIFNPNGIQQDGVLTEGREIDYSVDLVMQSKGSVTESGYVIEVALPFSSIRHRAGPDVKWGVHVQRRIRHLDEETSWMPLVRGHASLLDQAGAITGLSSVDSGRMIEVIPGITVSRGPVETDPSVTMKIAPTPNATIDATVNPDFAQIESDQLVSTANQRFPIFFAEKRPFFLEGTDVFQTPLNAVHTRTIVDPDYAAKASGKSGRTTFAAMVASDDTALRENAQSGVVRVKRDIGTDSFVGLLATSRENNRLAGVDGRIALDARTVVSFQLVGTTSDRGDGFGFFAEWKRSGRHLNINLSGEGRTRDYRADLGFTTQTNTNRWSLVTRYDSEPRPDARLLLSWSFTNTFFSQWDWQGRAKYAYVYPRVTFNFRRQTAATVFLYSDYLRLLEEEFGDFTGEPERSTVYKGVAVNIESQPVKQFAFALYLDHSWDSFDYDIASTPKNPGTGRAFYGTARIEVQPIDSLRVTFDHSRNRLVRDDSGRLAFDERLFSTQATCQFTAFAFARARIDSDSRSQFLLGWTPIPGTSLYAGYTRQPDGKTLFLKASYLLRRRF